MNIEKLIEKVICENTESQAINIIHTLLKKMDTQGKLQTTKTGVSYDGFSIAVHHDQIHAVINNTIETSWDLDKKYTPVIAKNLIEALVGLSIGKINKPKVADYFRYGEADVERI